MKIFELKKTIKSIPFQPSDIAAFITYKNGTKRKQEIYYGSSFLSQSARFLNLDDNMQAAEIVNDKGSKRSIEIK